MKKLHVFDSLKFVRAMFVAVATAFILNVAHADTTAIQSVIAYGKTEQSGTPTPTNPVPIMTNNGVLSLTPSLLRMPTYEEASKKSQVVNYFNIPIKLEPNTKYYLSTRYLNGYESKGKTIFVIVTANASLNEKYLRIAHKTAGILNGVLTTGDSGFLYLRINAGVDKNLYNELLANSIVQLVKGTSAKPSVYANGLTETIRDSAGHTARAEMLLGLDDEYRDEQNITTGAITRRVGVKVFDGTEAFTVSGGTFRTTELSDKAPNTKVVCSHFNGDVVPSMAVSTMPDLSVKGYGPNEAIFFKYSAMTTTADFKAWLAEQYANGTPVIVVYPLATETTGDAVAPQSLTTAPVRQTLGAIMNMPIKTILRDNTEIMSGAGATANGLIKIATTKYNEESFEDVQGALTGVFNAVDTVVSQTMTQAQAIDTIATTKQTRPNVDCPVGKNCLLVEDENGNPNWYVIAGADEADPTNP